MKRASELHSCVQVRVAVDDKVKAAPAEAAHLKSSLPTAHGDLPGRLERKERKERKQRKQGKQRKRNGAGARTDLPKVDF